MQVKNQLKINFIFDDEEQEFVFAPLSKTSLAPTFPDTNRLHVSISTPNNSI